MIVKIQRPLMTTESEPMALIYNQDRSIQTQQSFYDVAPLFDREELKVYHYAKMKGTILQIGERAPDQVW